MILLPDQAKVHEKCACKDIEERLEAVQLLGNNFSDFPDRFQAWQDLIVLAQDSLEATEVLGTVFGLVPDKDQAWKDLFALANDDNRQSFIQMNAAIAMGRALPQILNERRENAWNDLHNLANHHNKGGVRWGAALAIGTAFRYIPEKCKDEALEDLHRLANSSEKTGVKWGAAEALGMVFGQINDDERNKALMDLLILTKDVDSSVRMQAYHSLGKVSVFNAQAWQELHRLIQDDDKILRRDIVRREVAEVLGSIFGQVVNRDQAWQDLCNLAQDRDRDLRMRAYHSLGRASVLKATEAHDDVTLKKELDSAVEFFKKSSQETEYSPANFCYLFYRSYLAITFQEAEADEVQRYLARAKEAVGGSKIKGELLNAVENLSRALQESQRLKSRSVMDVADELNAYRWYCESAAEHMMAAEYKAPGTVKLMRRCNYALNKQILATIAEIQKKAELIGSEIDRTASHLSLDNPIKFRQCCIRMAAVLRDSSKGLAKEKSELISSILIDIEEEGDICILLEKIELAMAYILPAIEAERRDMLALLNDIQFQVTKIRSGSYSVRKDLDDLKNNINNVQDKIAAQDLSIEDLSKVLKEPDDVMIAGLKNIRDEWLKDVEIIAEKIPQCEDTDKILRAVQSLKQSKRRDLLDITGDLSSIAGLFIALIGMH